jgi:hypothetical protein
MFKLRFPEEAYAPETVQIEGEWMTFNPPWHYAAPTLRNVLAAWAWLLKRRLRSLAAKLGL